MCTGFGNLPKFTHWSNIISNDKNIPTKHTNTLNSTKLYLNSTLLVGYVESSAYFLYEAPKNPGSDVVLYERFGFTDGLRLLNYKEETNANICKVCNVNQILEFVFKLPT